MNFGQICKDVDTFDLHPGINPDATHLFFYGPPGVGKYAHAIHFLQQWSPSRFQNPGALFSLDQEVPLLSHYAKLPPQSFSFFTSDIHIEIDMEQLGDDPLTIWNAVFEKASDAGLWMLCRNIDRSPSILLDRLYTYILPQWPRKPPIRMICIGENICNIPPSILQDMRIVPFPRPSLESYHQCAKQTAFSIIGTEQSAVQEISMNPADILHIPEFLSLSHLAVSHKVDADDPFGELCERMVDCIQSVYSEDTVYLFSIEDVQHILTEWETYRICYEEGAWYVLGRMIGMNRLSLAQVTRLVHAWGQSGPYYESEKSVKYNKTRAEYIIAELISELCT
jgi:hypothetical protein